MPVIPINRSTIRKNPDAGSISTTLPGPIQCRVATSAPLPEIFSKITFLTDWDTGPVPVYRYLVNREEDLETVSAWLRLPEQKYMSSKIEIENIVHTFRHDPTPTWSFEYVDPGLVCGECGATVPHSGTIAEDEDGREYQVCPHCEETDTFGQIEYEDYRKLDMESISKSNLQTLNETCR